MNFVAKRFQTTAGSKITYNVPVNGQKFLIKNLTDGDVYVSLKETENKETSNLTLNFTKIQKPSLSNQKYDRPSKSRPQI